MDEELRKKISVFRYGVIADFVNTRRLTRGERESLIREKCDQKYNIPGSTRTSISRSTIKEWIVRYKNSGGRIESLYPQERSDSGKSRSIDEEIAAGLITLRKELPEVSLPVLLTEARARKIILPGVDVAYSTVYRFLKSQGLLEPSASLQADRRRFEAEYPNDMWQSDVMHGPYVTVDGKKRKTYLIAFIDDMSRLITGADFYLHERLDNFFDALKWALSKRGLPRKLYVDNGPAFRSNHLEYVCASLGITLIHSKPYQPEGRGKIERWFRTVRGSFLSRNTSNTLHELRGRFDAWVLSYNEYPHSATGETPIKRFVKHIQCIRPAPGDLRDYFRKQVKRTVARDRTVAINGGLFEAPVELIGKRITLLYNADDPLRIEILYEGKTYGFATVLDQNVNYRVKRTSGVTQIETENNPDKYKGGTLFIKKTKREDRNK